MDEEQARQIQASLYLMTGELVRVEDILAAHGKPDIAPIDALRSLGPDE